MKQILIIFATLIFSFTLNAQIYDNHITEESYFKGIKCDSYGDYELALKYFYQAYNAGDKYYAPLKIAQYLVTGKGVDKQSTSPEENFIKGAQIAEKTAEKGNPDAMNLLGLLYDFGIGVPEDKLKSNHWFRLSAEKYGHPIGKFYMAATSRSTEDFKIWMTSAAQDGLEEAIDFIKSEQWDPQKTEAIFVSIQNKIVNASSIIDKHISPDKQMSSIQSDIDTNIPVNDSQNNNTFAIIIGNEHYEDVIDVEFANRDADSFAKYCEMVLGVPNTNIRTYKDASYGRMISALEDIRSIAKAYDGDLNIIFYYAGHGIPNEKDFSSYLLPVDGSGRSTSLCLSLNNLYETLSETNANRILVFIDACFSGSTRGDGMLTAARGVAIKAQPEEPRKNMVVFSASSDDETAYPLREQGHGLFTYYLLKKLQESKGNLTLAELSKYINENVRKQSVVINRKSQTPTTSSSVDLNVNWFTK